MTEGLPHKPALDELTETIAHKQQEALAFALYLGRREARVAMDELGLTRRPLDQNETLIEEMDEASAGLYSRLISEETRLIEELNEATVATYGLLITRGMSLVMNRTTEPADIENAQQDYFSGLTDDEKGMVYHVAPYMLRRGIDFARRDVASRSPKVLAWQEEFRPEEFRFI